GDKGGMRLRIESIAAPAAIGAVALALAACGGGDPATGSGGASSSSSSASTGGSGGGTGGGFACDASGVSKGPWAQHIDDTSARVRFEACRADAEGGVVFAPESGGPSKTVQSTAAEYVVKHTYDAPLNPAAPPDAAGTYWLHSATIEGLSPGVCYRYHLAADAARAGRFCAAHPSGDDLRFFVIGDTNPGLGDYAKDVLRHTMPLGPEFTLHGGDIQYYSSGLETWNLWFSIMQPMLSQGGFFPAVGNHEIENTTEYDEFTLRYFGDAGFEGDSTHYTFENAGIHFFSLDTQDPIDPGSLQGGWLAQKLDEASQSPGYRFSIVYFHKPLVTCGDTGDNPAARAGLEPLFEQYRVPLVLQAHMHGYERFELGDLTYVTSAGGGGTIGDVDANVQRDYCTSRVVSGGFRHGIIFDVKATTLSARVIDDQGTTRDQFSIAVP
ncbi:MAG TPA: metallophosphoesterase, partial [Minicystis sp.]|nr:metallophosphoesterase [Minicystis sp.]